jgi:hypothetical protein
VYKNPSFVATADWMPVTTETALDIIREANLASFIPRRAQELPTIRNKAPPFSPNSSATMHNSTSPSPTPLPCQLQCDRELRCAIMGHCSARSRCTTAVPTTTTTMTCTTPSLPQPQHQLGNKFPLLSNSRTA